MVERERWIELRPGRRVSERERGRAHVAVAGRAAQTQPLRPKRTVLMSTWIRPALLYRYRYTTRREVQEIEEATKGI